MKRVIDSIITLGVMPWYYNRPYKGYTLTMPLTDIDVNMRRPLTSNSSFAENWCSSVGATLPRIPDETEQGHIHVVDFIRSAAQEYRFDRIQTLFVNNINHAVSAVCSLLGLTHSSEV